MWRRIFKRTRRLIEFLTWIPHDCLGCEYRRFDACGKFCLFEAENKRYDKRQLALKRLKERKVKMRNLFVNGMRLIMGLSMLTTLLLLVVLLAGCSTFQNKAADSAAQKNLNADGYVMVGELESTNTDTQTPRGRLIIGRLTYKSRKVGIPADQKVPTTGYFKHTKTKSLFGTEEEITEYDFTAGSDADAKAAREELEKKRQEAMADSSENATEAAGDDALAEADEGAAEKEKLTVNGVNVDLSQSGTTTTAGTAVTVEKGLTGTTVTANPMTEAAK
jgi:hypothetical protein